MDASLGSPGDPVPGHRPATPSTCAGCGAPDTEPLFTVDGHRYVRCRSCRSGRLDPLPDTDPAELYDATYFRGAGHGGYLDYDADAAVHRRNAVRRLDRVHPPSGAAPVRLLDIGCASGYALEAAGARGWQPAGVDISAVARELAVARGYDVAATIDEALARRDADVVTFFQVLEHMTDPAGALAAAGRATAPGAVVAVETWDLDSRIARLFGRRWQQANPPSVIHLFTLDGVRRMLERAGFSVVSAGRTPKLVSLGLVAGIAGTRWGRVGRAMLAVAERTRLSKVVVPYTLGDLVTVMAVKR